MLTDVVNDSTVLPKPPLPPDVLRERQVWASKPKGGRARSPAARPAEEDRARPGSPFERPSSHTPRFFGSAERHPGALYDRKRPSGPAPPLMPPTRPPHRPVVGLEVSTGSQFLTPTSQEPGRGFYEDFQRPPGDFLRGASPPPGPGATWTVARGPPSNGAPPFMNGPPRAFAPPSLKPPFGVGLPYHAPVRPGPNWRSPELGPPRPKGTSWITTNCRR